MDVVFPGRGLLGFRNTRYTLYQWQSRCLGGVPVSPELRGQQAASASGSDGCPFCCLSGAVVPLGSGKLLWDLEHLQKVSSTCLARSTALPAHYTAAA